LFIEAPYRNRRMFESLLAACSPQTRIGIAADLMLASQRIMTLPCGEWKRREFPDIDKRPTVFLLLA
jgi:16S rRNA (cytidine1402-2'-O)-methyltransferase